MDTLTLTELPELALVGVQEVVVDESEIGGAVTRLLSRLPGREEPISTVLLYDGTTNGAVITVTAGVPALADRVVGAGQRVVIAAGAPNGARVTFSDPPDNVGDAWIALDAVLQKRELRTTGPYRQVLHPDGTVDLEAAVTGLDDCA